MQDLCRLLVAMGARIEGIGSNVLKIEGVEELGGADFSIGPDYMEIGSFIGLTAVTRGELEIEGVEPEDLRPLKVAFGRLGISWNLRERSSSCPRASPCASSPTWADRYPRSTTRLGPASLPTSPRS